MAPPDYVHDLRFLNCAFVANIPHSSARHFHHRSIQASSLHRCYWSQTSRRCCWKSESRISSPHWKSFSWKSSRCTKLKLISELNEERMTESANLFFRFISNSENDWRFCSNTCSILSLRTVSPIFSFPFEPTQCPSRDFHAFQLLPWMLWAASHFLVRSRTWWEMHISSHRKPHRWCLRRTLFFHCSYPNICPCQRKSGIGLSKGECFWEENLLHWIAFENWLDSLSQTSKRLNTVGP